MELTITVTVKGPAASGKSTALALIERAIQASELFNIELVTCKMLGPSEHKWEFKAVYCEQVLEERS